MNRLIAKAIGTAVLLGLIVSPASAAVAASLSKSTDLAYTGENITVTTTVPAGQGIYVRLCKSPEAGASRPTLCYGQGSWASLDSTSLSQGAVTAANPITLAVKATFTASGSSVDCSTGSCVVFIRRDHLGSGDLSLDMTIPVSFAAMPAQVAVTPVPTVDQTISPFWAAKKYRSTVARKVQKRIARTAMLTTQGNKLTYNSETPKTCAVIVGKKYVDIKFIAKGVCSVTATATSTNTYKPTVFTWSYKVR